MSQPAEAPPAPLLAVREDQAGLTTTVPVVALPDDLSFDELRTLIQAQSASLTEAFNGRAGRLDLGSRALDLFDLRRLIHHLEDTCGCAITGLYATEQAVRRFAERELKLKLFVDGAPVPETDPASEDDVPELLQPEAPAQAEQEAEPEPSADATAHADVALDLDPDGLREAEDVSTVPDAEDIAVDDGDDAEPEGRRTLQVHRTVRSGNAVRFDGDVTIFGDVNPGAMVTASGSIVVLGALKGVAHAGATGDESAFILGLQLVPTQLRIGRRIAIASDDRDDGAEIAIVRDGRIVIEPYRSSSMARAARSR